MTAEELQMLIAAQRNAARQADMNAYANLFMRDAHRQYIPQTPPMCEPAAIPDLETMKQVDAKVISTKPL